MHRSPSRSDPAATRAPRTPFARLAITATLLGVLAPLPGPVPGAARAATGEPVPAGRVGAPFPPDRGRSESTLAGSPALPERDWLWPVAGARSVVEPFRAPAHDYGPGHRGMDIAATGEVRAPADGVVAFRGVVVDRPLLTIDHGDGLVTTLEPMQSALAPGTAVRRGDVVGTSASGGHAPSGTLHVGVRWNGVYINPMLLFGDVPRAVLLPCGADGC